MSAYVDYAYYTTTYLGTLIASADFSRLALRASATIDQITFNRAAAVITENTDTTTIALIKNSVCAVAEEIQSIEADGGADGIQSESVGSMSVTYADNSSKKLSNTAKIKAAAGLYLGQTGLMFPGFNDGEYAGSPDAD
jgi:hypothetical protein